MVLSYMHLGAILPPPPHDKELKLFITYFFSQSEVKVTILEHIKIWFPN